MAVKAAHHPPPLRAPGHDSSTATRLWLVLSESESARVKGGDRSWHTACDKGPADPVPSRSEFGSVWGRSQLELRALLAPPIRRQMPRIMLLVFIIEAKCDGRWARARHSYLSSIAVFAIHSAFPAKGVSALPPSADSQSRPSAGVLFACPRAEL